MSEKANSPAIPESSQAQLTADALAPLMCPRHESLCEACARGDHANCGRQSWCDCDCEGAIDPGDDCIEFDPYEGTTL